MFKWISAVAVAAVVLSACGGGSGASKSALYTAFSQSWKVGIDGGLTFIAEHDYPTYHYTAEECRATYFKDPSVTAFAENLVVDTTTMTLDAAWTVPSGRYAGLHPDGRVYVVKVNSTFTFNNGAAAGH